MNIISEDEIEKIALGYLASLGWQCVPDSMQQCKCKPLCAIVKDARAMTTENLLNAFGTIIVDECPRKTLRQKPPQILSFLHLFTNKCGGNINPGGLNNCNIAL